MYTSANCTLKMLTFCMHKHSKFIKDEKNRQIHLLLHKF